MHNISPYAIIENGLFGPIIVGWRRKWIILKEINQSAADDMVIKHHYSHKATSNRFLSMGVFSKEYESYPNEMLGVIQLGYGIRPAMKHTFGEDVTHENAREFDRMWLDDRLPKFSESIVLSCLEHYLRAVHQEVKYLITYADGSTGRTGTIYKAANYKYMGSIKADFYIIQDKGREERIHPVTMWHRHKTRAWETLKKIYPEIRKSEGEQFRFIKKLHN